MRDLVAQVTLFVCVRGALGGMNLYGVYFCSVLRLLKADLINKEEDLRTKPTKAKVMRGNEMKTVRAPSERSELQQHCKWVYGRYKARDGWEGGLLVKYYF